MNEVVTVLDAGVSEPPQLDIEADVFKAWTQGIKGQHTQHSSGRSRLK